MNQFHVIRNKSTRKFQTKSWYYPFTQEYSALQSLKGHLDIVFKTEDKGRGWVIIHKNYYQDKIVTEHLLSNVSKEISVDSDKSI